MRSTHSSERWQESSRYEENERSRKLSSNSSNADGNANLTARHRQHDHNREERASSPSKRQIEKFKRNRKSNEDSPSLRQSPSKETKSYFDKLSSLSRSTPSLAGSDKSTRTVPQPDYSPRDQRPNRHWGRSLDNRPEGRTDLWSNAQRYRGSLKNLLSHSRTPEPRLRREDKPRQPRSLYFDPDLSPVAKQSSGGKTRMFHSLFSLEPTKKQETPRDVWQRDHGRDLPPDLRPGSRVPLVGTSRMDSYLSWVGDGINSSGGEDVLSQEDEEESSVANRVAGEDSRTMEVRSRQSHFFNSLFPSRANRFGYPVFPEREFGIPSRGGPVSFAGFSPGPASLGRVPLPSASSGPGSVISGSRSALGVGRPRSRERLSVSTGPPSVSLSEDFGTPRSKRKSKMFITSLIGKF